MTETIVKRVSDIQTDLHDQNLDAVIIPRADEFLGEYVPVQNERLKWASGFTGSAGLIIVLRDRATIFVDGRYTIQVRQQVPATVFEYHHLVDEPPLNWLAGVLAKGNKVGYDPRMHTLSWAQSAAKTLNASGITLVELAENPVDRNWRNRPSPSTDPVLLLEQSLTGEDSTSKRVRIGEAIKSCGAEIALITQLDSIAWLLNIRGRDVPHLPVLLSFATLDSSGEMQLFTDQYKLPNDFFDHVGEGVTTREMEELEAALAMLGSQQCKVLADPDTANAWCQLRVREAGAELIAGSDPVLLPKAQKNDIELAGMKNCHVRDGVAVSRFLAWIDAEIDAGRRYNEAELADRLAAFRSELPLFHEPSFDTISAAGPNGALCHYNHMNGEPAQLVDNSLYLVDSGGQYSDGTTDITRTVAIGEPSAEHRRMFTLVLKGHIGLARAVFPPGTTGIQLDILARQHLWRAGFDYDHGTGHGVGAFLSVHEGPQRIAKSGEQGALLPGMVISNEPGFYKEGAYGIRCENLVILRQREDGMLAFETITLAPFDTRLVDSAMLTPEEITWLNAYHHDVWEQLSPHLAANDREWLQFATCAL